MLSQALKAAVAGDVAAIAVTAQLSAACGNKVMPPTYASDDKQAKFRHNTTQPDDRGIASWCSLDAPGSCANRIERALLAAAPGLAPLRVRFDGQRVLSTMELPHRVFDAVLRDSTLNGIPFRDTEIGKQVIAAKPGDAEALLRHDPGALLFGAWDSTGLGAQSRPRTRWARALTCEITATQVESVALAGNRIDPLGIEGTDYAWVEEADGTLRKATDEELRPTKEGGLPRAGDKCEDYPRLIKASKANHGNSLSLEPKGVLVHGDIKLHATLSLSRLRRYAFGSQTDAGRLLLATMGLYGLLAFLTDGLDLRSGCDLIADSVDIQLRGLGNSKPLEASLEAAREALDSQLKRVELAPVTELMPSAGLRDISGLS